MLNSKVLGWRLQVLAMTSSERIMGAAFVNHWMTSTIGWTIAAGILAINASDVYEFASNEVAGRHWMLGLLIATVALYLTFVLYLAVGPIRYCKCTILWECTLVGITVLVVVTVLKIVVILLVLYHTKHAPLPSNVFAACPAT